MMKTRKNNLSICTISMMLALSMLPKSAFADFSGSASLSGASTFELEPGLGLELSLGSEWDDTHRLSGKIHGAFFVPKTKGSGGGALQLAYRYRSQLTQSLDSYFELSSGLGMLVGDVTCAIDICGGIGFLSTAEAGLRWPASKDLAWTVSLAADWWLLVPSSNVETIRIGIGLDF
jgi:hypothetical protein